MRTPIKITALFCASLLLTATPQAQNRSRTSRPAVNKTALLVLLENGGVSANFADCKVGNKPLKMPRIPVARCGSLCFALNPGESVPQMLRRAGSIIQRNRACLNPRSWRVTQMTFEQWFKLSSDYLLEELTKTIARLQNTRGKYGRVVVLDDKACNPRAALAQMRQLSSSGYTLDIHVLTHGGNNVFLGGDNVRFDERSFFASARTIRGLKLRSVYQMNCVSGTLIDDWQKLGAKVVNGTYGVKNNYMPQAYFHFTAKWLSGMTFGQAIMSAYQEARLYTEPVYKMAGVGQYVLDSRQRVVGDANCRLQQPHNPVVNAGSRIVKQTVATLCASYKAARKTAAQAAKLLVDAGHAIGKVALELKKQYRLTNEQLCSSLRQAGCSAAAVATCMAQTLGCGAQEIARCMIRARFTARLVARELRRVTRTNFGHIAKYLRQAGCSTYVLADTLSKELRCSAAQVAKYLRLAGCSNSQVVKALKNRLKCSTRTIARHLRSAGCSFNQTARAIWSNSRKNANSVKAIVDAMVRAFNQNVAQVAANLAKLGIK